MNRERAVHPTPSTHHRFHLLDALRGIAAILVVFWHAPVYAKLPAAHSTFLAVDFFFCLSGFVIAFSYERRLEGSFRLQEFLAARLIRLYPVYLFGVLAGLCIELTSGIAAKDVHLASSCFLPFFCLQIMMLPGITSSGTPWLFPLDFPAWSLFFEVLANYGYAWMVRKRLARNGHVVLLFAVSLLVMMLWVFHGKGIDVGAFNRPGSLLGVPRVVLSFAAGVLGMRLFRARSGFQWVGRWSAVAAVCLSLSVVLLLLAPLSLLHTRLFSMFTVAFLFPVLVYLGAFCRLPSVCIPACSLLGDISYPLYLFHVHFLRLLAFPWVERTALSHPVFRVSLVPMVVLLTGGVSYLVLRYYGIPFRAFLVQRYNSMVTIKPVTT